MYIYIHTPFYMRFLVMYIHVYPYVFKCIISYN